MGVVSRALAAVGIKAVGREGQYRDGPWQLPLTGGWLSQDVGQYWNWWQMGNDPQGGGGSAIVEACVSAYAQTIAMCQGSHKRTLANGGTEIVTSSALSRILRVPNGYQTASDFKLNTLRSLLFTGNSYAIAERNNRFEVSALHLMPPRDCTVMVDPKSREVFYQVANVDFLPPELTLPGGRVFFPARDVLHIKLNALEDALIGRSPLCAAAAELAARNAMTTQMANFFTNMSRPSGVLRTDAALTAEQVKQLRERWNDQSRGLNAGGVPILTNGLQWQPLSVSAQDAQVVEALKLTNRDIATVFRVPLAIVNDMTGANYSNTEAMMGFWLASGLGFHVNHVEEAFDKFFGLPADEFTELDTSVLLRSNFKDRIEGLAKGVQGGIYAPNEARALEGLKAAKDGGEPRVQQQVVPLSAWSQAPPATPAPAAPPAPGAANGDGEDPPPEKIDEELIAMVSRDAARSVFRHAA